MHQTFQTKMPRKARKPPRLVGFTTAPSAQPSPDNNTCAAPPKAKKRKTEQPVEVNDDEDDVEGEDDDEVEGADLEDDKEASEPEEDDEDVSTWRRFQWRGGELLTIYATG